MGIFDLLDLADGASGDEAVARVVKKVVPPDDPNKPSKAAKKKKGAAVAPANDDLPLPHHHHPHHPQEREENYGGGRGRGQVFHGGRQGGAYPRGRGRGAGGNRFFEDANGDRFCYYGHDRVFLGNSSDRPYYNNNNGGDRGYNGNGAGYNQNRGQDGDSNYRNGGRQNMQYRPKSKPSSVAASEGDHKSEGNVEPVAEAKQVESTPAENVVVEAVPASESDKATGDVQKVDSKKEEGEAAENKPVGEGAENKPEGEAAEKKSDKPKTKLLSGSAKRKLKKQKPKKEDSNGDASIETASKKEQEAPIEEEKIEMTLEEYEKMQGKKKSLELSKPEERKVAAVAFEGLQLLEKKKIEDDDRKAKAKEAAAKEAKPRKAISIQEYLKPQDGSEYVAPPPPRRPSNGGYSRGRGNYSGRSSRDNSSEPRVYNSGSGENSIVFRNVGGNGNGAPRSGDGYNGDRRDGGYQRSGFNGGRGNGGYQERLDGYNGQQGGYNGGRGNGRYQHGGNNYRQRQAPKEEVVMTAADFPALGGASQAQSSCQSQAQA